MGTRPTPNCANPNPRTIVMEIFPSTTTVVGIYITYVWDGVSQYPGCNGAVQSVRVLNTDPTASGYVKLPNRRRGNKWIDIPPGTDTTISGGQLNSYGVETASDCENIGFSLAPDPV